MEKFHMRNGKWITYVMVILIVAGMVGAAELFQEKEIIFPEITAIAVGALLAPKMAWKTNRVRILLFILLCAVLGVGIVLYSPLPLWGNIALAYGVAEIIYLFSGTSFAPMISAIVLPVLLGTESPVYLVAAFLLTILILGCHLLLEKSGVKEAAPFVAIHASGRDWFDAVVRLALVALTAFFALRAGVRYVIAPPLLVAFTEFSRRDSGARKIPGKVVAAIVMCGLSGALCRSIINLSFHLPLTLAAVAATALMIFILSKLKVYVPPAGALCILPMLIPAEQVLIYPLQILMGAALFMALSLLVFWEKHPASTR